MKKRTQFNKMICKAKEGKYDLLVVREVSRFMRNAKLTLVLVDELLDCGVEVYFVNDGIWTCNRDDYFKLTIMAQYAEQESRKISERVFSGQAIARKNGVLFGCGNILGYNLVKGEKSCNTTYEIDEGQAKTVRIIYELALKGYGFRKIRDYLKAHGHLTATGKTTWHLSTINRILRCSTYMGEITYLQSVTEDALTHKRVIVPKNKRLRIKSNIPPIIDKVMWYKVQEAIDSRVNEKFQNNRLIVNGKARNKDVFCRKMRCGCGRRFKKDYEARYDTSTYRCYALVEDENKEKRRERSAILEDNCCIDGIRDWKLDLYTLRVFDYLECNVDAIKERLLSVIEEAFVDNIGGCYTTEDKMKVEKSIQKLEERNKRLLDLYEDSGIDKDTYLSRKEKNDTEIAEKTALKAKMEDAADIEENRAKTLLLVKDFINEAFSFPSVRGIKVGVPEILIDNYVNSIKACANNVFEYNIKVNPVAEVQIPVIPAEELNPVYDSAYNILDNSKATLLAEFTINYDEAKEYANHRKRKVARVHFDKPVTIRIYADL